MPRVGAWVPPDQMRGCPCAQTPGSINWSLRFLNQELRFPTQEPRFFTQEPGFFIQGSSSGHLGASCGCQDPSWVSGSPLTRCMGAPDTRVHQPVHQLVVEVLHPGT